MRSSFANLAILIGTLACGQSFAQDSIDRRAQVQLDRETARQTVTAVVAVPSLQQTSRRAPVVAASQSAPLSPPVMAVPVSVLSIMGLEGALEAVLNINGQRVVANSASKGLPYGWRVTSLTEACIQMVRPIEGKGGKMEEEVRTSCWVAAAPSSSSSQASPTPRAATLPQVGQGATAPLPTGVIAMPPVAPGLPR